MMRLVVDLSFRLFVIALASNLSLTGDAAEIWTGPSLAFEKPAFGDPNDPANQDRITSNVWITRDSTAGIYNAATEIFYQTQYSPEDTEWALGTTDDDLGSLTFETWEGLVGLGTPISGPPNSVGLDMVVHLVSDDIYMDLKFLSWGQGQTSGGGFSYERSTPAIPEPGTIALVACASLCVALRRRDRSGGTT